MSTPTRTRRGSVTVLHAAIAVQTLAVLVQAVTAGLLLSASHGMALHSLGARALVAAVLLHLAAAIVVWRQSGGPPGPVLQASGFLAVTLAQIALGIAEVTALHVPLGVVMFGGSVLQLARAAAERRTRAPA
ncbi:hypothetical protein CLV63_13843 [Murinocardiopsis flavida]|uniref:Uncharacterized protein n=1 Tax=Murinocardiopsis flavida TaxID=645275 RepID=A0A2P8CJB1_9ACTN|nr:hypothetical protein [Murinocardiopsis flavida]PSK85044.1 hypothetical protein CLV63_13843 [Murinocardiopsis flavida]